MRCSYRTSIAGVLLVGGLISLGGCWGERWVEVPEVDAALKSSADERAGRRAYDGAPPVIPHIELGTDCSSCHRSPGMAMEGVGFAPPSPHEDTGFDARTQRCRQCHVRGINRAIFVRSNFVGLAQNMRAGERLSPISPPTIPHQIQLRENCVACHAGPAAREEIRTFHPERTRCRQCHAAVTTRSAFGSTLGEGLVNDDTQLPDPNRQ